MPSRYDIYCPVQPDQICSAKAAIVGEFTGDPTGKTSLDYDNSTAEIILNHGLRDRSRHGEAAGCEGPVEQECPVQEEVSAVPGRSLYTKPGRWLVSRLVR